MGRKKKVDNVPEVVKVAAPEVTVAASTVVGSVTQHLNRDPNDPRVVRQRKHSVK